MTMHVLFAFGSAAFASLFFFTAPFSKRHTLPKWIFSFGMLVLAVEQLYSGLTLQTSNPLEIGHFEQRRFIATALLPGLWLLFAATYARGDMKLALKRRLPIIVPAFLIPLALTLLVPRGLVLLARDDSRPFQWILTLGWSGFLVHILMLVAMIGALVGLERTYRATVGTQRWKIKFMLYGLATLFAARFYTSSQTILTQELDPSLDVVNAAALILACLLIGRSLMRPDSFEIDLYPSQSIISGSVTITIAGAYLIAVGVLTKLVSWFGGEKASTINTLFILIAIVGLGLILQSDKLRQKIKRFVSRNFQRPLFDYRTVWLKVTAATSHSIRRKEICHSATRLLSDLFDVKLSSIWLLNTNNLEFILAASSDIQSEKTIQDEIVHFPVGDIPIHFQKSPEPFDLDAKKKSWSEPIRENNKRAFKKGGNRICIPLIERETVVGLIVLGDRTNQLRFSQQEFDTLTCIANHLAASIFTADLTRKLADAKEVEAFQTMATFFVHDLKNAVSTLNLMLKNMPKHWDNPEFREDALRGLGSTSERITKLITRLGNVRDQLEINPTKHDLKELVSKTVDQWKCSDNIKFTQKLTEGLFANADSEKLKSVIMNLLVNAVEAMGAEGSIELSMTKETNAALITVKDTGSGMSEEFIRNSLFRPFKTTKKTGLGIGMFQSKMIVEAHKGSLQVESEQGIGSTFTVHIPTSE